MSPAARGPRRCLSGRTPALAPRGQGLAMPLPSSPGLAMVFVLLFMVPFLVTCQASKPETCHRAGNGATGAGYPQRAPRTLSPPAAARLSPGDTSWLCRGWMCQHQARPLPRPHPWGAPTAPPPDPKRGDAFGLPWHFGRWKGFIGVGGVAGSVGPPARGSRCSGGGRTQPSPRGCVGGCVPWHGGDMQRRAAQRGGDGAVHPPP